MVFYKEEDFYKSEGRPTEHFLYCSYIFPTDSLTEEWGLDYDKFAYVSNSLIPYIRLIEKRGQHIKPCGGKPYPPSDGSFAKKSDNERDQECPKLVWGISALFLINIEYDNQKADYIPLESSEVLYNQYYKWQFSLFLSKYSGLKYQSLSINRKEFLFIEEHRKHEEQLWERSIKLKKYSLLYTYSQEFVKKYLQYLDTCKERMVKKISYSVEIRQIFGKEYLKVFLSDNSEIENIQSLLKTLASVKTVNISRSESNDHRGDTLTVYPKSMCSAKDVELEIKKCLDNYEVNVTCGSMQKDSLAHFSEIEMQLLSYLDNAKATIDVCIAWFTNDKLRDKLLEKQKEGIKVRVIIYHDGVNKVHGVDLSEINHKDIRGERGGIMHDKFCIIDNVTTITGSYNWTTNAEFKNDENIAVRKEDYEFASSYTRKFNEMWDRI